MCRDTNIPGDGNCVFHSLIRVLQLQISSEQLRIQLLNSVYLQNCTDPETAIQILSSRYEYTDYNCLYIFSREYHQNVCVHFQHHNINKGNNEIRYCHFTIDEQHSIFTFIL